MTTNPIQPAFLTDPAYPGVYFGPEIELGSGGRFDPGTYIGYATGRKLDDYRLYLGEGALIRFGSTLYQGSRIGARLQTGHGVVIREQNIIGDDFSIWNNSTVDYGCTIGNHVKVHSNCYVAQYTILEDNVFLAPGVTIANDPHPGCEFSQKCMRGPTIKRGAQIGANTTILPFVTIGEGAVIGSGSLVSRDVPPFTVAYGNPARPSRSVYDLECLTGDTDRPYHK